MRRDMACQYSPRRQHAVDACLRLSGLEPRPYLPNVKNMRSTFMNIGERCNVAGSSIYKKAIVDGDYDKALGIGAKQASPSSRILAAILSALTPHVSQLAYAADGIKFSYTCM